MSIIGNSIIVGLNPKKMLPTFTYSGNYEFGYDKLADGTYNWELALLSGNNTNLVFKQVVDKIDIFIVGSGANGERGRSNEDYQNYAIGGKGGNGGEIKTITVDTVKNENCPIYIGTAGNNTSITIDGITYSCSSGGRAGTSGGNGAVVYGNAQIASVGGDGTQGVLAFGSSSTKLWPGRRYAATGGGGGAKNSTYYVIRGAGNGGFYGAGNGGSYGNNGSKALDNSGSGGGGGGYDQSNYNDPPGGAGGSGIIIIRNHRES